MTDYDQFARMEYKLTRNHTIGNLLEIATGETGAGNYMIRQLTDDEANMIVEALSDVLVLIENARERKRNDAEQDRNKLDGHDEQSPPVPPTGPTRIH